MPLPNYSTTVDHQKTAEEIRKLLRGRVRRTILDEDGAGNVTAIQFIIETEHGTFPFRLPVNVTACQAVLQIQRQRREIGGPYTVTLDRARRVAWRILKDWIRAQLGLIDTGMVATAQVFLPYLMLDEKRTMFDALKEGRLPLMLDSGDDVVIEVTQ